MNADAESDTMMCCAACGTPEVDDVKLKDCSACKLVRYCGVKCQKDHRLGHSTNETARRERLNYVTKFYSSSLKSAIAVVAPFVVCRCPLMQRNLL